MSLETKGTLLYNYPGVDSPFLHQKTTTKNLVLNPRHQIWNEIGTGKTFSAAWAIDYLIRLNAIKNVILIAPISTLEVVWQRTLWRVNPDLDVAICKGIADKRRKIVSRMEASNQPTITLINPDGLHIIAELPAADLIDLVVVDESAMFRNSTSRRYDALCKLVGNYYEKRPGVTHGFHQEPGKCTEACRPVVRRVLTKNRTDKNWQRGFWPMSGSPQPEQPTDVWSIAVLVSPKTVPEHFSHFRDLTMIRQDQFTWVPRPNAEEVIAGMLRGTVTRFTREDCFDLPEELPPFVHELTMTDEQKEMVRKLKKEALLEVEAGLVKGVNAAVIRNKFLQIFSGAVKAVNEDGESTMQKVDCYPKLTALDELVESTRGPIIVGSEFMGSIARIAEHCKKNKITYRVVVGETNEQERRAAFDDLQADKYKLLVAHPRTIAHGLTLTTSNVVLWWTPIDSQEIYDQFCGRIRRPGQLRKTYIIHFVCSALERAVIAQNQKKGERQDVLLKYLEGSEV